MTLFSIHVVAKDRCEKDRVAVVRLTPAPDPTEHSASAFAGEPGHVLGDVRDAVEVRAERY